MHLALVVQLGDEPLRPADDRAGQVERRPRYAVAGQDEVPSQRHLSRELVGLVLDALHVLGSDVVALLLDARGEGELCHHHVEVTLHLHQDLLGARAGGERAGQADGRRGFVERAVRLRAGGILGDTAAEQVGIALVSLARVEHNRPPFGRCLSR